MRYRQCLLKRGTTEAMAWIPEPFAKIGKYLRLGDSDGWLVDAVYGIKDEEYVFEWHRDYIDSFGRTVKDKLVSMPVGESIGR